MPIYEYRCSNGHVFEVIQRMSDDPVVACEQCEAPVERVFHPVAVHFKGSGFYSTDYGSGKAAAGSGSGASGDGEGAAKAGEGGKDGGSKEGGGKKEGGVGKGGDSASKAGTGGAEGAKAG